MSHEQQEETNRRILAQIKALIRLILHYGGAAGYTQTMPSVPPALIAHRVKGRLQYLVRRARPKAFRRNYSLRSLGSTRSTGTSPVGAVIGTRVSSATLLGYPSSSVSSTTP